MVNRGAKRSLVLTTLLPLALAAHGQELPPRSEEQAMEAEFLAILNLRVTVASGQEAPLRESPGIVTVLTRPEILASGARDLVELLRLVPGFEAAGDLGGSVSLSVRGLWATEGKVLIRLDGQEVNELLYGSQALGNHFLTQNVQRIEIIRGPGSAIYGGFAELAVVNIVTRRGGELDGFSGALGGGWTADATSHRSVYAGYGFKSGDLEFSLNGHGARGNRSGEEFTRFNGTASSLLVEGSYLNSVNVNVGLTYGGLNVRFIEDRFAQWNFYPANASLRRREEFNHRFAEVSQTWSASAELTFTALLNYKRSEPYHVVDTTLLTPETPAEVTRLSGGLRAAWDPNPRLNLTFGAEGFEDTGRMHPRPGQETRDVWLTAPGADLTFNSKALYAQALWRTDLVNLTLGGRQEWHSTAGKAFVPRLGLTRVWGPFHVKLLAARAFRTPVLLNIDQAINPAQPVRPELATTWELEGGWQLAPQVALMMNLFTLRVDEPIVFTTAPDQSAFGYQNRDRIGSRGLEASLLWKGAPGRLTVTGAYYEASGHRVQDYQVAQNGKFLLGASRLQFSAYGQFTLTERLDLAPSLVFNGPKYGQDATHLDPPRLFRSTTLVNLFLNWRPGSKLLCSAGVSNLTDEKLQFVGAYPFSTPPIPAQGRELSFRVGYNL